ncbi:MAG: hypothetical protein J1E16_03815 [Muribaculaceae bacterium]|nr:hypothetical protein [Muribaculaceae bacterium]
MRGRFVAFGIFLCLLVFAINTGFQAYAQSQEQKKHEIKEEESFERPQPTRPIQPEIPSVNRYQEDKVFLEYADSLYKRKVNKRDTIERQILKGNVKFRQAGLWMFCDSAYYYPEENSLDAFSNVKMEQGDTLFVYADQLFYNGDKHLATLKNGPTREKVTLINKDVTLTTDSLDYDMEIDLGWYVKWGTIDDKVNTLTSLYGEYSPKTKRAEFFQDVVLENHKDGFTMYTDTLYYSTETHIANIESRTLIQSENDTIITNLATYYTDTGDADLLSRSMIIHRDSTGNIITLEGDSIIYDNKTRISRAYMYRDPFKRSTPMVITDTAQKTTLIGGFGIYNDSTKEALATIYPLLMEYSQGDTLFLRADTIKTFIVTEMIPDKRRRTKSGYPEWNEEIITMKDSVTGLLWIDTTYFKVRIPYADAPQKMLFAVAPPPKEEEPIEEPVIEEELILLEESPVEEIDAIEVVSADSIMYDKIEIIDLISEYEDYNVPEVPMVLMESFKGLIPLDSIKINSIIPLDTVSLSMEQENKEVGDSIPYEFHVILAYHRGRFFKQDMQGVADSIVFVERDSMLYLFRKPIVWSEERQVTGNRIDVHFNDSTTDWAYLPEYGLMSEYVDEDFYNQIYGKEITAYFKDQGLRRMSVSGNVETIFLPQEEDSTFNRLVNAESSYMEVYLDSNRLDWLKMWPEVSGTVTPIFLVKRPQMYLQKFKWWGFLRPQREWYGDRVHWADNLGEVPDELEQYFMAPSDFGEPKTFTGPRVNLPTSSLPIWEDFPMANELDSLATVSGELDSLINVNEGLMIPDSVSSEVPDSISSEVPSLSETEAEKTETFEDIVEGNQEEEEVAKEAEEQSAIIEEQIKEEEEADE